MFKGFLGLSVKMCSRNIASSDVIILFPNFMHFKDVEFNIPALIILSGLPANLLLH